MTTTTAEAPEWALHINAENCRHSFMVTEDAAWISNGHWMVRRETVPELRELTTAKEVLAWGLGRVQRPEPHPAERWTRISLDGEPLGDDDWPLDRWSTIPGAPVDGFVAAAGDGPLEQLHWTTVTIHGGRVYRMGDRLVLLDDAYTRAIRRDLWFGSHPEQPVFDQPQPRDATAILMPMRLSAERDLRAIADLLVKATSGGAHG